MSSEISSSGAGSSQIIEEQEEYSDEDSELLEYQNNESSDEYLPSDLASNTSSDNEDPEQTYNRKPKLKTPSQAVESCQKSVRPNDQEHLSEGENQKSRKRVRNETQWKKNKRKSLRASGKEYINARGQTVPAKTFVHTSSCCTLECYKSFSPETQNKIDSKYYSLGNFDLQTGYVFSQVKVRPVTRHYTSNTQNTPTNKSKAITREYYLPNNSGTDVKICKNLFKKILMVSDGKLDRTLKKKTNLMPPKDQRGRHPPANKTDPKKVDKVCEFIRQFPTYLSHYSRHKTQKKYLGPDLNIRILYTEYKKKNIDPVSEHKCEIFNTKFNLHFHPPIVESCKTCDSLKNQIKYEQDQTKLAELNFKLELHQRKAEQLRNTMDQDGNISKEADTTVIAFDLMKTLPTLVISTGITYYKRQLWTYCLGVHDLQNNDATMYVWDESIASRGAQEVGSYLMHYIKHNVNTKNIVAVSLLHKK